MEVYHDTWCVGLVVSSFDLALIQTLTSPPTMHYWQTWTCELKPEADMPAWACMELERRDGYIHTIMYLHHDIFKPGCSISTWTLH